MSTATARAYQPYFAGRFVSFEMRKIPQNKAFYGYRSTYSGKAHCIKDSVLLDPACGSGGMFVQSAHFVERLKANPAEQLTFYGLEKNPTTIRLAKMNLAVHGLEGNIQQAITYYEDPHALANKADFVMANPPFNVDEVDAEKVKGDTRLPFGLPSVNKSGRVSNANYIWISYFYSYLNDKGRAGFVMSSQASSSSGGDATVRQKLIETGDVDLMIAIRPNFFYTRTVPCELWFLNRNKPEAHRNKVLMLDARNIYRKVTRKIYDFSPEQLQNLLAIVWLYRGEKQRFLDLIASYLDLTLVEAKACLAKADIAGKKPNLLEAYLTSVEQLSHLLQPFLETVQKQPSCQAAGVEVTTMLKALKRGITAFTDDVRQRSTVWARQPRTNADLYRFVEELDTTIAESSRLSKQTDSLYRAVARLIELCETELDAKASDLWPTRDISRALRDADAARHLVVAQLKQVRYFQRQAHWLTSRFPEGELQDVPGLVKLVDEAELAANDWSLTPGRYVGVAPIEEDEDFDFEQALRDIQIELEGLNAEAAELAAKIARNLKELGI